MQTREFSFRDPENISVFVYQWLPDEETDILGVVQVAHGMAETAERYARFAKALTDAGYIVYANDHRGHGRTASSLESLGDIGDDGYRWMVRNLRQLNEMIHASHPQLPVFLFGHSMGSFLAQSYMAEYGETVDGVVLSGTVGKQGALIRMAVMLARRELKRHGPQGKNPRLHQLMFRNFNKRVRPQRTNFDWLSRDIEEVDAYIRDPYCGNVLTTGFYYHLFQGLANLHAPQALAGIPRNLPIFFMSGSDDPVGGYGKGVLKLVQMYKSLGFQNVTHRLYSGGRHEMLNEVNRDEVSQDIIRWLNERTRHASVAHEHDSPSDEE